MAKVMFVVRFLDLQDEKGHDDEININSADDADQDNANEHEKGTSDTNAEMEEPDNCKDNDESKAESDNGNKQKDNISMSEESSVPDANNSDGIEQEEHSKGDGNSSDTHSPDSTTLNDVANNLDSQTSQEKNTLEAEEKTQDCNLVRLVSQEPSLFERVKQTLDILNVTGVQWSLTEDDMHVATFITDYGAQCELIIKRLSMLDIGIYKNSSINVFPASICVQHEPKEEFETLLDREDTLNEKMSEFKKSIKSRLVVDQVVTSVQSDAVFTFDFLMLVILASFVAVMGLLESSSVVLVASMLISPLMGPILATVFGTVIRKADLVLVGVRSELIGLSICILVGFVLGFIPAGLEAGNYGWRSSGEWPTVEMSSRGAFRSLLVGILIAVPSGAGVALSILGGKIGSLVGVAISASLLPPAVNAGLLWANAIVMAISPPQEESKGIPPKVLNVTLNLTSNSNVTALPLVYSNHDCSTLLNNDYAAIHSCNMAIDSLVLGFVSLSLTILNIACIIAMGIIVLKLKEVAPLFHTTARESEKDFFCEDLRVARESYVTTKGKSAAAMRQQWLNEYKNFTSEENDDAATKQEFDHIMESVEDSPMVKAIVDKMPVKPKRWSLLSQSVISNKSDASSYFSLHSPSMKEEGFELSETRVATPRTPFTTNPQSSQADGDEAVYYTVHRFIHPRTLISSGRSSYRRGKFHKKLNMPQESRFMVAKIAEPPEMKRNLSMMSSVQEETSQSAGEKNETDALLT